MIRKFTEKPMCALIIVEKLKNGGKTTMSNGLRNLKELIERYMKTLNNEDLCNDSDDLIDFIETIRDDILIARMKQAGDDNFILTPPTNDGSDEQIIE